MSHTSTIDSVVISDVGALRQAIAELKGQGVNCELLENAVPRAYYANQTGLEKAPLVIKLNDSRYDVGLYDNGNGGFEARTDFWGGDVQNVLGAPAETPEQREQAKMGRLFQTYAVCAAESHAALNGYSTQRSLKEDGTVQLVLTAAA
jgi:hypothetical protein